MKKLKLQNERKTCEWERKENKPKRKRYERNKGNFTKIMRICMYCIRMCCHTAVLFRYWLLGNSSPLNKPAAVYQSYQSATNAMPSPPATSISPTPVLFFNPYPNITETPNRRRRYDVREAPLSHRTCGTGRWSATQRSNLSLVVSGYGDL
jgi:hypothetical protein